MGEIAHARDRILAMLETQMFKKYMLSLPKDLADQVDDYNIESFFWVSVRSVWGKAIK